MRDQIIFENDNDMLYFDSLVARYNIGVDYDYLIKIKDYLKLKSISETLLYYIWYKLGDALTNISEEHTDLVSWIKIKFYYMTDTNRPVGFYYFEDIEDYQLWLDLKDSVAKKLDTNYSIYYAIFDLLLINNKDKV